MNTLRVSNGLPPLIEDPIINAVAQATAKTMADNLMSWHIGNVSGRLAAVGYGGSATVWATENFAVGNLSIDEIMVIWSDAAHMTPPATETPTPAPTTPTLIPMVAPSTPTPLPTPTQTAIGQETDAELSAANGNTIPLSTITIGLLAGGSALAVYVLRRKR
jgi:hypothetical protein